MGDVVADACADVAAYLNRLEELLPEPVNEGIVAEPGRSRPAVAPEPWNAPAGRVLMTGHELIRRLLASLRLATAGHTGIRHGGTRGNDAAVLAALPKIAAGLDGDGRDAAAGFLIWWVNQARMVRGIDEVKRWRHLPQPRAGEEKPPCCPYCGCYQLVADVEARVVACTVPDCWDDLGLHPVASMTIDEAGRSRLEWAGGRVEPGLDGFDMRGCPGAPPGFADLPG